MVGEGKAKNGVKQQKSASEVRLVYRSARLASLQSFFVPFPYCGAWFQEILGREAYKTETLVKNDHLTEEEDYNRDKDWHGWLVHGHPCERS